MAVGAVDFWVSVSRAEEALQRVSSPGAHVVTALHFEDYRDVRLRWRGSGELQIEYASLPAATEQSGTVEVANRQIRVVTTPMPGWSDGRLERGSVCVGL